jgi:two-component system, LuxR family, response regulator FixJ
VTEPDKVAAPSPPPIVYIIDDDRDVRHSISFMLHTDGIANRAFAGGQEFMEAQPSLPPGCLLLDVRMPRMSGLDVLAALNEQGCTWPVVVMTGHGEGDLGTRAIRLGARDFIEKPFEADLLLHCLRRTA